MLPLHQDRSFSKFELATVVMPMFARYRKMYRASFYLNWFCLPYQARFQGSIFTAVRYVYKDEVFLCNVERGEGK